MQVILLQRTVADDDHIVRQGLFDDVVRRDVVDSAWPCGLRWWRDLQSIPPHVFCGQTSRLQKTPIQLSVVLSDTKALNTKIIECMKLIENVGTIAP